MPDPGIGDYALVGDTRTAALISKAGSIDWMCAPTFDAPPLFGVLIDDTGGRFSLELEDVVDARRRYLDGSAVLSTRVETSEGRAEIVEAMVANVTGKLLPQNVLVREVRCTAGRVGVRVLLHPRRGLPGRDPGRTRAVRQGLIFEWGSIAVSFSSTPRLELAPGRTSSVDLAQGESLTLVLTVADRGPVVWVGTAKARELVEDTGYWWREWSRAFAHEGPYRDAVVRSLVTLRLLTYSPSGAPVAAPTTSLPEAAGFGRNWDYRYAWPRDAAIGLAAFLAVENRQLAHSFLHWLLHATRLSRPRLRVLYDIYGRPAPKEHEVDVSGFRHSTPVRVGNDARTQHQLDVYGWVVDAAWLLDQSGHRLHDETWRALAGFADFVSATWRRPDAGIWEVRGEPAQFVHSKLMAWLALDRMSRMASRYRLTRGRAKRWARERDDIAVWIRTEGTDHERNALVWRNGRPELDASLLLLPILDFEPPRSPLVVGTIDAVRRDLEVEPGLLLRYPRTTDGLDGDEGAFLPCSFWLVQALARVGRQDEAAELFDRLLSYSNDVGLFGEEIDPATKEHLGNFPQAFTHATVVQAALALQAAGVRSKQTS